MPGPNRQRSLNLSDVPNMQVEPDGNLKIKLGRDGQKIPPPFPAPIGMCVIYMGLASNIGVGDWLGWQIVTDLTGSFLRLATDDSDIGQTGGSATHGHTATVADDAHTHTLSVDSDAHTHTLSIDSSGTLTTGTESVTTFVAATPDTDEVADDGHTHDIAGHNHTGDANSDSHNHTGSAQSDTHNHTATVASGDSVPPYLKVYLVRYVGVTS